LHTLEDQLPRRMRKAKNARPGVKS
jgi:hypothetical protein